MKQDKPLTQKQENFCNFYATAGSETQGNAKESAKKAGYSPDNLRTSVWKIKNLPKVKERIKEIHDRNSERYAGSLYSIFERIIEKAEAVGKYAEVINATDKMCKITGVYKAEDESINREQRELSEADEKRLEQYMKWAHRQLLIHDNSPVPDLRGDELKAFKDAHPGGVLELNCEVA